MRFDICYSKISLLKRKEKKWNDSFLLEERLRYLLC